MMVTGRSTPAAGQARRQGAAASRSPFGFMLGPLQLEDARVGSIRDLGQNRPLVAPEALRRLPLPGGVVVDPGVERADRRWQVQAYRFRNPLPGAPAFSLRPPAAGGVGGLALARGAVLPDRLLEWLIQ